MVLRRLIALITTITVLWSAVAWAQATPQDPEEIKREAAAHYHEGRALFDKELYEAAIERFRRAHELFPAPANLYNIAKSYERLGASTLCVESYESYLAAFQEIEGRPAPDAVDIRNAIEKCRLGARIPLTIESDPPGASVFIDKAFLGQTPYSTLTDPGSYKLRLSLDEYVPFEQVLDIRPGEPLKVVFKLEKHRAMGNLAVRGNVAGASIYVDGRNVGLTPFPDTIELDAGSHQITVKKDDYAVFSKRVDIQQEQLTEVDALIFLTDPPATWKGYTGYTTMAFGAGALVAGYFLGAHADTMYTGTLEFDEYAGYQKLAYGSGAGLLGLGLVLAVVEALDDRAIKPGDAITYNPSAPWGERFARGTRP